MVYLAAMKQYLSDLVSETKMHFQEGALSVRAYGDEKEYIIRPIPGTLDYEITTEAPAYAKYRTSSLQEYFDGIFGIEARY